MESQAIHLQTDWLRLTAWFTIIALANVLGGWAGPIVLLFVVWPLNLILGCTGVYFEMTAARPVWPKALVIFILVMFTPGSFINYGPWPILPTLTSFEYMTSHPRIAVSSLLTVAAGAFIAWVLAMLTAYGASLVGSPMKGFVKWLIPLPLFLLMLLVYNLAVAVVLKLMCLLGLYSDMGFVHRIS